MLEIRSLLKPLLDIRPLKSVQGYTVAADDTAIARNSQGLMRLLSLRVGQRPNPRTNPSTKVKEPCTDAVSALHSPVLAHDQRQVDSPNHY